MSTHDNVKRDAKARRSRRLAAIAGPEALRDSDPRTAAQGTTSAAIKTLDPATRRIIDRAAVEAGYMPLAEYVRLYGEPA